MNIYDLSRKFWDFAFENPDKIKPNHGAMYFFAIEHCNRLGWKEKFGFPTVMAMEAIGIKSYNTFINTLKDLVEYGFIEMIEKSKNQYSSNIIALSNFNEAHIKALDKALMKHGTKQSESTEQSTGESIDSINKQIYNNTNLPINNNIEREIQEFPNEQISGQEEVEQEFLKPSGETPKKVAQKKGSKTEKKYFTASDFKKMLLDFEVEEKDADDWINVRRQKRAVFTKNAIDLVLAECEKYNFSFPEAIKASALYGWQGFEYEWYLNKQKNQNGNGNHQSANNGLTKGSGNTITKSTQVSGKVSASAFIAGELEKFTSRSSEGGAFTFDVEAQ